MVDPLLDIDFVVAEARKAGFDRIAHVIDIHNHADHMSSARNLERYPLPIVRNTIEAIRNMSVKAKRETQYLTT
ncbi:MAG TPA: hypothetical protein VJZ68_08365 [Nitrososphaera sp.]|nr:hypothetical protein [Nitrososphaera sp.]